ncbi:MAG: hypothetical protein P8L85_19480 [Rubripirellula sp.]|nr:hypothetical protein [Rubripirellula sp.]
MSGLCVFVRDETRGPAASGIKETWSTIIQKPTGLLGTAIDCWGQRYRLLGTAIDGDVAGDSDRLLGTAIGLLGTAIDLLAKDCWGQR